jgi:hypothetical protein
MVTNLQPGKVGQQILAWGASGLLALALLALAAVTSGAEALEYPTTALFITWERDCDAITLIGEAFDDGTDLPVLARLCGK